MNAPDWKRAPAWAKFVAMDSSGAWWWYEERPVLAEGIGIWTAGGTRTEAVKFPGWPASLSARDGSTLRITDDAPHFTLEQFRETGWTDEQLIAHGYAERVP